MHFLRVLLYIVIFINTSFCTAWCRTSVAPLGNNLQRAVAHTQAQQSTQPTQTLSSRQAQIKQALQKLQPKEFGGKNEEFTRLSYSEMLYKNQQMVQKQEKMQEIYNTIPVEIMELVSSFTRHEWATGRPNYGELTKGTKFIFLTDSSSHDQKSIVDEVRRVLRSVRTTNPHARILLALEFANLTNSQKLPIRFAKHPDRDIYMSAPYNALFQTADQLNMDLLSLDDLIITEEGFKFGNASVWVRWNEPELKPLLKDTQNPAGTIMSFVPMTTWGMQQRNNQWAAYIQAIESFYNIVIVYCGSGHTESGVTFRSLPELINQPLVSFNFYSDEQLSLARQQQYEQRYQTQCEQHSSCNVDPNWKQAAAWVQNFLTDMPEWDGKEMLYLKTFDDTTLAEESLSEEQQEALEFWTTKMNEAGFVTDAASSVDFFMFLPDTTLPAKSAPRTQKNSTGKPTVRN